MVLEASDGSDHLGEHTGVESRIEFLRLLDEGRRAEALGEHVDVGEVAGLGTAEEGEELAAGEFERCQGGAEDGDGRSAVGWGVDGEVNQGLLSPARSTTSLQNVGASWTMTTAQPRLWSACANASLAGVTDVVGVPAKRSRSSVGRAIRSEARSAAPPATR
nr:hypothetical protein [Nocardioides marmorisolisilvae]